MSEYTPDAWGRLAKLLRTRRGRIDQRFSKRSVFCEETGLNYKLVSDIEGAPGTRTNFTDDTFIVFETNYQLAPGAIKAFLESGGVGELQISSDSLSPTLPALTATVSGTTGSTDADEGLKAAMRELAQRLPPDQVRSVLEEYLPPTEAPTHEYDDEVDQYLWETPDLTESERKQVIMFVRVMREGRGRHTRNPAGEVHELRTRHA